MARIELGEGYYIQYEQVSNGFGGCRNVNMILFREPEQMIKMIVDQDGYFSEYPGVIQGDWNNRLQVKFIEKISFSSYVHKEKNGLFIFYWEVQPDGRYWTDEDGLGMNSDECIELYAYMDKKGEFLTPFADFQPGKFEETLQDFKLRLASYAWNSIPAEGELWTAAGVMDKINPDGTMRPFYGNTIVFPLGVSDKECVAKLQDKLYQIPQADLYLAEKLEKDTFHITLHDLVNSPNFTEIEDIEASTEIIALKILEKVKHWDIPAIQMKPKYLFNMAGSSLVLGFEPVTEQDCRNLFMLHDLFQSVVELSYPLTPHVTLAYFKSGKYKAENLKELRYLADIVNDYLNQDDTWVVTLDVKELVYQRFYSMNKYRTMELNCL